MTDKNIIDIDKIETFHGSISVKRDNGMCFVGCPDYDQSMSFKEIPLYLYDSLIRYNNDKEYK